MIKIHVNNNRSIELSKTDRGTMINVDVIDDKGEVDYNYIITEVELVTMLNQFEHENNQSSGKATKSKNGWKFNYWIECGGIYTKMEGESNTTWDRIRRP